MQVVTRPSANVIVTKGSLSQSDIPLTVPPAAAFEASLSQKSPDVSLLLRNVGGILEYASLPSDHGSNRLSNGLSALTFGTRTKL